MNATSRFDGTSALQLDLINVEPEVLPDGQRRVSPSRLRLLRQDVYVELTRRRRRAQIAARRIIEDRHDTVRS